MKSPLSIIISREYLERVKRKSFIISTILVPLLFVALTSLPALIMTFSGSGERKIAVIDDSGVVAQKLQGDDEIEFVTVTDETFAEARDNDNYDAVLVIGDDVVSHPDNVAIYTHDSPSMRVESFITSQMSKIIEDERLMAYEIADLRKIIEETRVDVKMSTFRIGEEDKEESSTLAFIIGEAMSFILYFFIILYGQMVMTSIIEEKNNRVLEIIVSSVDPKALMMGKIVGVGLVALTQIMIWIVLIAGFSAWALPLISGLAAAEGGGGELSVAIAQLSQPGYLLSLGGWMILFVIGGYLLYAAILAAVGSAVDNIQDASQLQTVAMVPIMAGMILSFSVINDPNSSMAVFTSIFPLTSPMVMMARVPFEVPLWQLLLSVALLYVTMLFTVWLAAKIYRVGILVYGKKPNFAELIKWARYK